MSRHFERRRARPATAALIGLGITASLVLSGCAAAEPGGDPEPSSSADASATAAPSATPSTSPDGAPRLVPDGTADDNLPLFTSVTADVWATPDNVSGRAYIDALEAAGFDKATMQVTPDQSTVGNPAETIQFSVQWGPECLVGQVGPSTGAPVTVVVPVLAEGTCLIGQTRPIDW